MWKLSLEQIQREQNIRSLMTPSSDEEWEEKFQLERELQFDGRKQRQERLNMKSSSLLRNLPERFHPYIHNGMINQPELPATVRADLRACCKELLEQYYQTKDEEKHEEEQTENAINQLTDEYTAELLQMGFHDGQLLDYKRENDHFVLRLEADGFNKESFVTIHLYDGCLEDESVDLQEGLHWIYSEAIGINNRIGLRVIWEFPQQEWTVTASQVIMEKYYQPKNFVQLYSESLYTSERWPEVCRTLNPSHQYFLYTDKETIPLAKPEHWQDGLPITETGEAFYWQDGALYCNRGKHKLHVADSLQQLSSVLVTDVFEDAFAIFSLALPDEELEEAIKSKDIVLQTRAWNTLTSHPNPQRHADLINRELLYLNETLPASNFLVLSLYTRKFYEAGVLTDSTMEIMKVHL